MESLRLTESYPPPLENQLHQLIACFNVLSQRLMLKRPPSPSSDVELSPQEVRVLMAIGRRGTTTMSDLARVLQVALSTATNTMDKLVGKEMVERTRVDEDRRIVQVTLTEEGRRFFQTFIECQLAMGRSMLESLSPGEREIFLELMAKMTLPAQAAEAELEHAGSRPL